MVHQVCQTNYIKFQNIYHIFSYLIIGTGKTLLARAIASNINGTFLKVVASAIVQKYIGIYNYFY